MAANSSARLLSLPVPPGAVAALRALAREEGATLDAACHALVVALRRRYAEEDGRDPTLRELVRAAGQGQTIRVDEHLVVTLEEAGNLVGDGVARHFARLAEQGAQHPDESVRSLPLFDAAEREALVRLGAGAPTYPRLRPFHLTFADVAAREPAALAVARGADRITYGELEWRSNAVAHHLLALGLQPEGRVGVCLLRSPDFLVALLGVWKAGGAYVPIDPAHPAERIAYVCADSGMTALITNEAQRVALPAIASPVVVLDGLPAGVSSPPASAAAVTAASLAYLIYTSGSTGRPRAVMVEHGSLANAGANSVAAYRLGPETRMLYITSSSFDASLDELFVLLGGGALLAPLEDAEAPGPDLLAFLARERITVAMMTPSMLAAMDPVALPALELLVVGGEECPAEVVDRWQPGRRFLDAYGPTEATVYATLGECTAGRGSPSIGRPIAGVHCYILDRDLELVPRGATGELCIGGAAVARGYHGHPDLTASLFVRDPYQDVPGARLYRTGDLARFREDGELEYLGRRDEQVKVRGVRIDLGEIRAVLLEHPMVREAAVVQRQETGHALVGYVVFRGSVDGVDLRKHLRDRLPAAYVPSWIVPLAAIPRTTSGKLDRERLPLPTANDDELPRRGATTASERSLLAIWVDLLRHGHFGVDHDFFDIGGHSLAAAQLVARIQRELGIRLSVSEIIRAPTVRELAAVVDRRRADVKPPAAPGTTTFQQEVVARDPRFIAIHDRSVRIRGALDVDALERALAEIVARHAVLRATFPTAPPSDSRPKRERLVVHDLRAAPASRVEQVVAAARAEPFDLRVGPLFRRALVVTGDDEHVLLLLFHPAVTDAAAEDAIVAELGVLYVAYRDALRPALAPPRVQLAEALARREPTPEAAPESLTARERNERAATMPTALWQQVRERAAELGVTPEVLALLALARVAPGPIAMPVPSSALAEHGVRVGPRLELGLVEVAEVAELAVALGAALPRASAWPRVAFELRSRPRTLALDALEVAPLAATARLDLPGDLALRVEIDDVAAPLVTCAFATESGRLALDLFFEALSQLSRASASC